MANGSFSIVLQDIALVCLSIIFDRNFARFVLIACMELFFSFSSFFLFFLSLLFLPLISFSMETKIFKKDPSFDENSGLKLELAIDGNVLPLDEIISKIPYVADQNANSSIPTLQLLSGGKPMPNRFPTRSKHIRIDKVCVFQKSLLSTIKRESTESRVSNGARFTDRSNNNEQVQHTNASIQSQTKSYFESK